MTGLGDRILGLGLLVLAVAYGWVAQQWPEPFGGAEAVGPETFPTILSVVLVVGSLYLMVKPDPDAQWPVGKSALELVVSLVVLVAYALLLEPLGYLMEGFAVALTLNNLMYALFGAFVGTLIGCLPGLGGITGKNPMKTVIAAALGIMISTVGIDISTGTQRYTFGVLELYEGIDFILAIVGLFAISELLFFVEHRMGSGRDKMSVGKITLSFKEIVSTIPTQLRGGILGFISGVLPGAGASLGSFISYTLEKQVIGTKGKFGEGDIRGVVAPEAGNNGASSGALVPMLTLGVPGSGTTAVLLAVLISLNITPGPPMYLLPIVTMVAFVGIYSISHSAFDLYFMVAFGVAGYFLRKLEIPLVPIILGLLLGPEMEKNLAHAMVLSVFAPGLPRCFFLSAHPDCRVLPRRTALSRRRSLSECAEIACCTKPMCSPAMALASSARPSIIAENSAWCCSIRP